jgi:transposase
MKASKTSSSRRQYDAAFKAKILELHEQGRSVASLAASFGVNTSVIYQWRRKAAEEDSCVGSNASEEEVKDLRKQLREVELERDILKKALGIFSRQA